MMGDVNSDNWSYTHDNVEFFDTADTHDPQEADKFLKPLKIVYKHTLSSVLNNPNVWMFLIMDVYLILGTRRSRH